MVRQEHQPGERHGGLTEAIKGADLFIGLSRAGVLSVEQVKLMSPESIVFAMANPDPEIWPEDAWDFVRVIATGRSDYPNQVNNALCFPGMFRGVLDVRAREINDQMKLAAAQAIAASVPDDQLTEEYIMPGIFNRAVVSAVAQEVAAAARMTGVAQREFGPPEDAVHPSDD